MEMNMIAEGYYAAKSAFQINTNHDSPARTPIINAVYDVLYNHKNPKRVFKNLAETLD